MKTITKLTRIIMIAALLIPGIRAHAQCTVSYTYSTNPANNGEITFTGSSVGVAHPSFFWDFGDGGYSYGASPTYTYAISGSYTVYLEMHDSLSSCADSVMFIVSVVNNSSSGCVAAFAADSISSGHFWNHSLGTGLTSVWSFGDGSSGTSNGDITHVYTSPGTYYVCLNISNFAGTCSDSYCDSVYIPTTNSGMCQGSVTASFTVTDSASYGVFYNTATGTGPVYFWDFGDGATSSTVGNIIHYYSSPGTYPVCLTVYETGGTYDSCQYCSYVTIGGNAGACDASFAIIQDSTNLLNYFIYNNTVNTSPTATYFWDFGDGTSSNLQYPFHNYPASGPYYICLTVTDSSPSLSCTNTYCDSLAAGRGLSAPITLTVVNPMTTGITEAASAVTALKNYPNPFNGNTTISYSISKDANVELNVTDLLGNKIASLENSRKISGNYSVDWNAENVAGGMYLLQIKVNQEISTRKIILNK